MLSDVDILIDETWSATPYTWGQFLTDYSLPATSTLKFVSQRQVWRLDGLTNGAGSGNDWFSGAVAEPDAVLEDLIGVVRSGTPGTWLRRLNGGSPQVAALPGSCVNPLATAVPRGQACAAPSCPVTAPLGADEDAFPHKVQVVRAKLFTVEYHKTYKVVHNTQADEWYLLYQCGTPRPAGYADHKNFSVPLQAVAVADTSVLHFLELLGVQGAVRYMQTEYTTSACLQAQAASGAILSLLPSTTTPAGQAQLAAVNALFTYSASPNPKSIAFTATSDPGPLNRAEWIKFAALFFNQEAAAETLFNTIQQRYLCHQQAVSGVASKPVVAWTYYATWSQQWVLSRAPYKRQFLQAAGAQEVGNATADETFTSAAPKALSSLLWPGVQASSLPAPL